MGNKLAPGRRAVKKENRGLIGGADISALLGVSPRGTPFSVWDRIVNGAQLDENDDALWEGRLMEPVIATIHTRKRPPKGSLRLAQEILHPTNPHGIGHLDGLTDDAVLEFKAVNWTKKEDWLHGTPPHVHLQCDWYMQCADRQRAEACMYVGFLEHNIYDVPPLDSDTRGQIHEVVNKFWRDHIVTKKPPAADGTKAYSAWLKRRFPLESVTKTEVALPDELAVVAKQYVKVSQEVKKYGVIKNTLKQVLEEHVGSHSLAVGGGVRVTYSVTRKDSSGYRTMRVKELK